MGLKVAVCHGLTWLHTPINVGHGIGAAAEAFFGLGDGEVQFDETWRSDPAYRFVKVKCPMQMSEKRHAQRPRDHEHCGGLKRLDDVFDAEAGANVVFELPVGCGFNYEYRDTAGWMWTKYHRARQATNSPALLHFAPANARACRHGETAPRAVAQCAGAYGGGGGEGVVRVAVHIRRGDQLPTAELASAGRSRLLPDAYFLRILRELLPVVSTGGARVHVHVFSESHDRNDTLQGVFLDSDERPSTLQADVQALCSATVPSGTTCSHLHLDGEPLAAFHHLAMADVLLTSRSGFSLLASVVSDGVTVAAPLWLRQQVPPEHVFEHVPGIVMADLAGAFDVAAFGAAWTSNRQCVRLKGDLDGWPPLSTPTGLRPAPAAGATGGTGAGAAGAAAAAAGGGGGGRNAEEAAAEAVGGESQEKGEGKGKPTAPPTPRAPVRKGTSAGKGGRSGGGKGAKKARHGEL